MKVVFQGNKISREFKQWLVSFSGILILITSSGCFRSLDENGLPSTDLTPTIEATVQNLPTPLPTRPEYAPGEQVDYICQTGDNLPALAARFNTSELEIRQANDILPKDVTTLPPGLPLKIPIYYRALWGTSYQIIPDGLFVNGPAQVDFDPVAFVDSTSGWLKSYRVWFADAWYQGGEIIQYFSDYYSISPRLLLALIEYQAGGLTDPVMQVSEDSPLGMNDPMRVGLVEELLYITNFLNNGYYGWRTGELISFEHNDKRLEYPDPWQNAATVALQRYYAKVLDSSAYTLAVSGEGLAKTYASLFGDPWQSNTDHIPGSLTQPEMSLPFAIGFSWAFTGGPHTGWGDGAPLAAIDFAPPNVVGGCSPTTELATAMADGVISRTGDALAILDLDGDMDERTGWVVLYLHLANDSLPKVGTVLKKGDPIGVPSCEGGQATGTHVHIARKYNGEWISAAGVLAFNLDGWIAYNGAAEYMGELKRFSRTVIACQCSDINSQIQAGQ
ncbi:MAG: LysM peptidoglycan-binding domain-containing protein [Anaerolineaceae bacterium]